MKKVIFLITQTEAGGAQKYVFELASALKKSGQFEVLIASGGNDQLIQKTAQNGLKFVKLRHLKRSINPFSDLFYIPVFLEIYKLIKSEKPDIVHLNSSKIGVLGSLAGKLAGVPKIIFTVHGWVFNEVLPFYKKWLYVFASWLSALFQDKIICVSEHDRKKALKYHVAASRKLVTINNGIDKDKIYFLSKEDARDKFDMPKDKIVVGTIANFYKTKGIIYLIEAAGKISSSGHDILFLVIGDGPERKALESKIEELNLKDNFKLVGRKENASQYLKSFDIFIMPSLKEGFPYALLEAGLAKVPVIATNVGGISDIIDEENGVSILSRDSRHIKNAILSLLNDHRKMKLLSEDLYNDVVQKFTFESMYRKTLEVYDN